MPEQYHKINKLLHLERHRPRADTLRYHDGHPTAACVV